MAQVNGSNSIAPALTPTGSERVIYELRSLYESYGFKQFSMSKFEQYDLYARNKDFLISENIITFTDTNGKLMALKPDVTLSIVKSTKDHEGVMQKLYYNENVYRVSKGTGTFKEIMQVGLECIGLVDFYSVYEVLQLAAKSLLTISPQCVLSLVDARIVTRIIGSFDASEEAKAEILRTIIEKNPHELSRACSEAGIEQESFDALVAIAQMHGAPSEVAGKLSEICALFGISDVCDEFLSVVLALEEEFAQTSLAIKVDFSTTNDTNYYNAIGFRGFVQGISSSVISGGQYDLLMRKMGRKSGAIGFACYMDLLEELDEELAPYDIDTLIVYSADDDFKAVAEKAQELREAGESVMVQREVPEKIRYRRLVDFDEIAN